MHRGNLLRTFGILFIMLTLIFAVGCGKSSGSADTTSVKDKLAIKVLDVGQGDSILILNKGTATLIDTGDLPAREQLIALLRKEGVTVVNNLILTHPHNDHIGGAVAVMETFTVKQIYDSGQTNTSKNYRKYMEMVDKKKIPFKVVKSGDKIDLGSGVELKVMSPGKTFLKEENGQLDLNNNSIVTRLTYGNFSMIFAADTEKESEERMVAEFANELKSNVLKVAHHGSNTSSSADFLRVAKPDAAIISCGVNNDYHHPHPGTLKKFEKLGSKIYRTDLNGTVTVITDGKKWDITKEKG